MDQKDDWSRSTIYDEAENDICPQCTIISFHTPHSEKLFAAFEMIRSSPEVMYINKAPIFGARRYRAGAKGISLTGSISARRLYFN